MNTLLSSPLRYFNREFGVAVEVMKNQKEKERDALADVCISRDVTNLGDCGVHAVKTFFFFLNVLALYYQCFKLHLLV